MKKNSMRFLSFLLAAIMVIAMFPAGVFAEDTANDVNIVDSDEKDVQDAEKDPVEIPSKISEAELVDNSSIKADDLTFTVDEVSLTATVTDGKSASGEVVIPAAITYDGKTYAVTAVAGNAFNDANEVTKVTVPNSVTSLGGAAFANMDKLTEIVIGNGVTSWGSKLAVNNSELTTVVLAEGATLIGDLAFRTCPKLANVTLPSTLKTIGATAFTYSAITELTVPASVVSIGSDSFKDIDTLKKVTFLGADTKLSSTCFQMCDGLEEVILPANLTSIPQGAFRYCTALKTIDFPETLTEIGNYSFQGCTSLESVTISKNITNLVTNAFNGCTSLKNLTIEEGFNGTIGGYVFQGCTALESVVIPSSMETVGESMFNMCSSLKDVTLSEGVKTLNISAFANCTSLETLVLPDSLERMRHGSIANCTALKTLVITGDNLPVIEHSNALDGLSDDLVIVYNGDDAFTGNWTALADNPKVSSDAVALIGTQSYETLADAIAAANAAENGATVTLLTDVTLGEKLTITGNVTIKGAFTITRADAYTGTLFAVEAGATLTLDGGLTIDGNNGWTLDEELYNKALAKEVTGVTWADLISSEEDKPEATAPMFLVKGSVVANDVTIQNNYSSKSSNNGDYGVFKVEPNATLTMTGATVKHIVTGGANSVAHLSTNSVWTINDGTLITDTFAAKNGGICRNDSGKLVMNGGEISDNKAIDTNGTVVMLYKGSMEMNGGMICSNSGISGTANGRCAVIYGHNTSTFIMTDGEICHNTGISYGGVDVPSSIKVEISGGYIGENISVNGNANADVNGNENTVITGGTFTQDISAWLAPNTGLEYVNGQYTVINENLFKLHLTDPNTGEPATIPYIEGNDPAELVAYGKLFYADYYKMTLEVLYDVKIDKTVVIDYPMTIDLNGHTLTADTSMTSTPVIRVVADVTVTGNGKIDGRPGTSSYAFIVGQGENAGNLTIENGTFYGSVTAVSVTKGTATINGGNFAADPYVVDGEENYNFLLNCIDTSYKDGTAKIDVKGGTFYKFNPADNAAEGANTSFVNDKYLAEADGDYYTVRVNKNALPAIADIVITTENGETITLKYPGERFDSIQHMIGTNDYADFVLGADQNEMLAYVASGNVTEIVMTLYDDIELDAPLNFYNKYFQVPVTYDITINGNNNTITWADGYNGTLINVENGANVTLKNLTIDGENAFTFYNDTTTVENDQNWYTRFVDVGEEDKAINDNVIVNAGNLTLDGVSIRNVTIASDGANGKTENTESGYVLKYNDDLALIKSNGGRVTINGGIITYNAGMVLNAINAETSLNTVINYNMGVGNKGGIIIANGGTMDIKGVINYNKAMARSATILGVVGGAEVTFDASMSYNKHIGVGSNTAGAMIVLEGASQFVMNGGVITYNEGGRAGAIASRWVGGNYGQHEDTSIVLNAGNITGNTASNDSWNGASIFLRSPATIGKGMTINGTIAVNAAPGSLEIDGGTFFGSLVVTDGLTAEITGGTFYYDPTEWLAEDYEAIEDNGVWTVKHEVVFTLSYKQTSGPNVLGTQFLEYRDVSALYEIIPKLYLVHAEKYLSLADVVLTLESDIVLEQTVLFIGTMTFDLNSHTITTTEDVNPAIRIVDGDVTVKNGTMDTAGYCFILGSSDGALKGYLTIESGSYTGTTSVVSVTKGALTILGGEFKVAESNYGATYLLNCIDANYKDGSAVIEVKSGTFYGFNPENNAAEGAGTNFVHPDYKAVADGDYYTVRAKNYVVEMNGNKYESIEAAVNAVETNNSEPVTIKVLKDHVIDTNGESYAVIRIDGKNVKIDLNGCVVTFDYENNTNIGDLYASIYVGPIRIGDSFGGGTLVIYDSSEAKTGTLYNKGGNGEVRIVWCATNGTTTIESGNFVNEQKDTMFYTSVTKAYYVKDSVIKIIDGNFKQVGMVDGVGYDCFNMQDGTASMQDIILVGGTFNEHPKNGKQNDWEVTIPEDYIVEHNDDDTYTVRSQTYVEWIKAELLAGNSVKLDRDVVITDYDLINALVLPSNGNGKYTEVHGNGAIFHIIKPGVVFDLNGYSLIWDAHDDVYCNKRQVSLFMVTITGNPGETADLTIIDSSADKTGKVDVYGMGTGLYVVGVDAKGTISGGTWTNYPCKTCGASNIFIYPSHGGELYITDGTFEQKGSDYLIGWNGSSKPTTNNGVGTDQDATKVYITGGTFVGFNPETDVKFIDTANGSAVSEVNGCAENYESTDNGDGTYGVIPTKLAEVKVEVIPGTWLTTDITIKNWADLVAALGENTNVPVKVTLLENIKLTDEVLTIAGTAKKVIDLNGKTITGTVTKSTTALVYVTGGCELTLLDSSENQTGGIHAVNTNGFLSNLIRVDADSKMVIESGNYSQDLSTGGSGMIDSRSSTDAAITVKGGTFELGNPDDANGPWIFNVKGAGDHHVYITGGTFNADVNHQKWANEAVVDKTCYMVDNGDGTWTVKAGAAVYVSTGMLTGPYYFRKDVGYATFEEALAAALRDSDGPITLLADLELTAPIDLTNVRPDDDKGFVLAQNGFAIVLKTTDATLTAPEGLTVTTDVANRKVVYENGVYKLVVDTYAAQIGDTLYETLQDAIDAAKDGDEIVVLENIDIADQAIQTLDGKYNTLFLVEGKSVIINLNSKTISGAYTGSSMLVGVFSADKNGKITLTGNGTVDVTATQTVYGLIVAYSDGSSIIIENGTYKLDKASDSLIYYGGKTDAAVTVKGGTFELGNLDDANSPWIFNVKGAGDHHVLVTGGTFNADINRQKWSNEVIVPETYYTVNNGNGTWTVHEGAKAHVHTGMVTGPYYAPKEIGYATFEEALAAAIRDNDGPITLLADLLLTGSVDTTGMKEGTTINQNGFAIKLATADATLTAAEGLNVTTDLAGCKVVYEEGTYKVVSVIYVAEVNGTKYETLADAIQAAQPGDVITLLTKVTEDVTVNKSLTIDGANLEYTGNISVKGSTVALTVKNVNFVNGTGYAITTNTIKSITVENCTVENYGYGFLYANKSTPTVVVKDVKVNNTNYGFNWAYGTTATFENFIVTNTQYGLRIQNYAGKTITLKNCDISSIAIWERSGSSGVQTFKFEGANKVAALSTSQYAKYELINADATLTAPEGYTVFTNVADHKVVYEEGTYKVIPKVYVAEVNGVKYETLKEAFEACTNGETITLLMDLVYDADDVVYAHGGATGFGDYDQYNPSIIYIGGSRVDGVNSPSNVNAVLDLNGYSITNNADAYLFMFMDNCKVTIKDSKNGDGIIGNSNAPIIWVTGTETLVTIENGKYTVGDYGSLIWSTHGGDLVIKGGEFSTSAEDASSLIMRNSHDRQNSEYFIKGNATVTVYGGTFYGFNPEKMLDDAKNPAFEFNAVAPHYMAQDNGDNSWTVVLGKVFNASTGNTFATIADAMLDAKQSDSDNDQIELLQNHKESVVIIYNGATLNLKSFTLEADYLVSFAGGYITGDVRKSSPNYAKLIVPKQFVALAENAAAVNASSYALPVWDSNEGAFVFGQVAIKINDKDILDSVTVEGKNDLYVQFNVSGSSYVRNNLLINQDLSGFHVEVVASWINTQTNNDTTTQVYRFSNEALRLAMVGGLDFSNRVMIEGHDGLTLTIRFVTDAGVVLNSAPITPASVNS